MNTSHTIIATIGVLLFASISQADDALRNGDFENGQLTPWFAPQPTIAAGWSASIVEEGADKSLRSAMISHSGDLAPTGFGNLLQSVAAEGLQGKRVRLTAKVKQGGEAGTLSRLWLRVDRPGGKVGFFDNCADRPVTKNEWQMVEITGDVEPDATGVIFGLMSFANL